MGRNSGLIGVAAWVALTGCKQEQGIAPIRIEQVAVAAGDFDRLEDALFRNDIRSEVYEGYINSPVYDVDEDASYGVSPLQVEKLFTELNKDGDPLLFTYDALFLNSGVRGLGEYVYNDVETDDALVTDADVVGITKRFVARNRTLVVSDWAYDLVEATWPDKVTFLGEHEGFDSAQRGTSASVVATVTDKALKEALGTDQLEVFYDFSYWTVMESVGAGVDVHLRGDVEYRADDGSGTAYLQNVPLLVSFDYEGGRVILSSFAWRAQRQQVADTILLTMIEGLDVAATGDQHAETSDAE
jgi:hypothetical protein